MLKGLFKRYASPPAPNYVNMPLSVTMFSLTCLLTLSIGLSDQSCVHLPNNCAGPTHAEDWARTLLIGHEAPEFQIIDYVMFNL